MIALITSIAFHFITPKTKSRRAPEVGHGNGFFERRYYCGLATGLAFRHPRSHHFVHTDHIHPNARRDLFVPRPRDEVPLGVFGIKGHLGQDEGLVGHFIINVLRVDGQEGTAPEGATAVVLRLIDIVRVGFASTFDADVALLPVLHDIRELDGAPIGEGSG